MSLVHQSLQSLLSKFGFTWCQYEHCVFYQQVNNNFCYHCCCCRQDLFIHPTPLLSLMQPRSSEVRIHHDSHGTTPLAIGLKDQIHHAQAPSPSSKRPTLTLLSVLQFSKTQDCPQWLWSQGCTCWPINVHDASKDVRHENCTLLCSWVAHVCSTGYLPWHIIHGHNPFTVHKTWGNPTGKPFMLSCIISVRATLQWSHSRLKVHSDGWAERDIDLWVHWHSWLSSVYSNQWLGTWDGTLPDAAVILRDQAEEWPTASDELYSYSFKHPWAESIL